MCIFQFYIENMRKDKHNNHSCHPSKSEILFSVGNWRTSFRVSVFSGILLAVFAYVFLFGF
ncbi:hypothetical protein PO909_021142 [Leuciscus waleckii]